MAWVLLTFGLQDPTSINNMFTNWLLTLGLKQREQLFSWCFRIVLDHLD
jgi:hypothetical protein